MKVNVTIVVLQDAQGNQIIRSFVGENDFVEFKVISTDGRQYGFEAKARNIEWFIDVNGGRVLKEVKVDIDLGELTV